MPSLIQNSRSSMDSQTNSKKRENKNPPSSHPTLKRRETKDGANGIVSNTQRSTRFMITDDLDFDKADFKGRIQRCKERIEAGYAIDTFKAKLQKLIQAKERQEVLLKEWPSMGMSEITRLQSLQRIAAHLRNINDPCRELQNVTAIMAAYKSRELKWNYGIVTYWCQGKIVLGPKPFSWEDFRRTNTQSNRGTEGFWVEGIFPLKQTQHAVKYNTTTHNHCGKPDLDIFLTLDSSLGPPLDSADEDRPIIGFKFEDDTGSSMMSIYNNDMRLLMGDDTDKSDAPPDHLMGFAEFIMANGAMEIQRVIAVEVNMVGRNDRQEEDLMLDKWTSIPATVTNTDEYGEERSDSRLAGPWLRSMFWVGSAPGYPSTTYAATKKEALDLPSVSEDNIEGPRYAAPDYGVEWVYDQDQGIYRSYIEQSRARNYTSDIRNPGANFV